MGLWKKVEARKKYIVIVGFVLLAVLGFVFYQNGISGNVVLELDAEYHEGEVLDGVLKLSLSKGEFIPASSKVVFESAGERFEFDLEDVLVESPVEGDYFIEGREVSGRGMGFGEAGVKKNYPEVSFLFNVYSDVKNGKGKGKGNGKNGDDVSVDVPSNESEEVVEEVVNESEVVEEVEGEVANESEIVEEDEEEVEEVFEEVEEEVVEVVEKVVEEEVEEVSGEEVVEEEIDEVSLITGEVVLALERDVSGKVSKDEDFVYKLKKNERAELVSGSVGVGSKVIDDESVVFEVVGNEVSVSSDYFEVEEGFGEDYIDADDDLYDFEINLSAIDLNFSKGDLNISFVYGEEEVVSLSVVLDEGEVGGVGELILPEDLEVGFENLTEEERQIIVEEFGNVSVRTTRAEVVGGRLIRNYKIGDYELVASYEYDSSDNVSVVEEIERDKVNFLRDLAKMILDERDEAESVVGFLGSSGF